MVYESDFYTVRRPYSTRITPTISSYSVTTLPSQFTKYLPGVGKVYVVNTYNRQITPGYQRLVYEPTSHVIRVRPSIYIRELDRIEHKYRPHTSYSYLSDYLNSRSAITFEDEKRAIRAQSAALLQRVHAPVPRVTVRMVPLPPVFRYQDSPYSVRLSPEAYIQRMVTPVRRVADNILRISYYHEPAKRFLGPGHLACVRFAGDKAYDKRKHISDLTDHVIRNDINLLSYYLKNREAASVGGIPRSIAAPEKKKIVDEPEKKPAEIIASE